MFEPRKERCLLHTGSGKTWTTKHLSHYLAVSIFERSSADNLRMKAKFVEVYMVSCHRDCQAGRSDCPSLIISGSVERPPCCAQDVLFRHDHPHANTFPWFPALYVAQDKFKDLMFPENTRVDIYETGPNSYSFTAKEVTVESAEHLLAILADAEKERKTSRTQMNAGCACFLLQLPHSG